MTDIDPKDDPLDLLAALDAYRAACAELALVRESVARAAGLWGVRQVESLTWAEVAAAAARTDRETRRTGELPPPPLLPEVVRVHAATVAARQRFANLALTHSRATLFVMRRGPTS